MNTKDRFKHHPPKDDKRAKDHEWARAALQRVAVDLDVGLPPGREKALAMTKLEEALFWANAAIARQDIE